jgi:Fe-S-cluster containining protein
MSVKEVKEKYLSRVGFKLSINEDTSTHDCVFLRENGQGKVCAIYSVRPAQCRSWPFWPSNLAGPESWNMANQRCPGINRGQFYSPEQIEVKKNYKKWTSTSSVETPGDKEIIARVGEIYKWLDEQLDEQNASCEACGKCCDFESFGHRLFITTPEMIFFAAKIGPGNIKKMTGGRCPYQTDDKCTVYPYRFAGCQIFSCKGSADFQSELTEESLNRFKSLCNEFQIPYRYVDLPTALQNFTAELAERNIDA